MEKICKKNIILKILLAVIVILITKIALTPINKNYDPIAWMKNIDDSVLINDLSIPGTHDSGAMHSIFDVAGKCQEMNIQNQLNIGVRFLDIRLQLVKDELQVVHSFVKQDLDFVSVLEDLNEFITSYNSEFLIVSIKKDNDSVKSTVDFSDKVLEELGKYQNIVLDTLPSTVKEARGKIYILNRFTSENIGIMASSNWKDSTSFELGNLYVQDNYSIDDINIKLEDIKKTFELSISDFDHLHLIQMSS